MKSALWRKSRKERWRRRRRHTAGIKPITLQFLNCQALYLSPTHFCVHVFCLTLPQCAVGRIFPLTSLPRLGIKLTLAQSHLLKGPQFLTLYRLSYYSCGNVWDLSRTPGRYSIHQKFYLCCSSVSFQPICFFGATEGTEKTHLQVSKRKKKDVLAAVVIVLKFRDNCGKRQ